MMKKVVILLVILFEVTSLFSQTVIEKIDTTIQVKIPILFVEKESILDNIVNKVLSYNVHNKECYKNYIYSIEIQKDSLNRGYIFYVGLFPDSIFGSSNIIGVFMKNNRLLLCTNDSLEDGYIKTDNYKILYYKKEIAYIIDGIRFDNPVPPFYDPPTWIFIYREKNRELELFRTDFLPLNLE